MTKPRAPLSIDAAITRAAGLIPGGWAEMAELTGRAPSLVRAWGDPDRREEISLRHAIIIDRACLSAAGEDPLKLYYAARLASVGAPAVAETLGQLVADLARETGEATAAAFSAALGTASPGAQATARHELLQAKELICRALAALDRNPAPP